MLAEASEWARHFAQLEQGMDAWLADMFGVSAEKIRHWVLPGRYVSGPELAEAGIAELIELKALKFLAQRKKLTGMRNAECTANSRVLR